MQRSVRELAGMAAVAARDERAAREAAALPVRRYRGVRERDGRHFTASIWDPEARRPLWLGSYATPEEAAYAYDAAARRMQGRRAKPNFPEPAALREAAAAGEGDVVTAAAAAEGDVTAAAAGMGDATAPAGSGPANPAPADVPEPSAARAAVPADDMTAAEALTDLAARDPAPAWAQHQAAPQPQQAPFYFHWPPAPATAAERRAAAAQAVQAGARADYFQRPDVAAYFSAAPLAPGAYVLPQSQSQSYYNYWYGYGGYGQDGNYPAPNNVPAITAHSSTDSKVVATDAKPQPQLAAVPAPHDGEVPEPQAPAASDHSAVGDNFMDVDDEA